MMRAVYLALVVLFALGSGIAIGVWRLKVWARSVGWAPPFSSTDPRPVQVTLRRDPIPGSITFQVPRAWIAFSEGQDTKQYDEVPDRITTGGVRLELADPGIARTVWLQQVRDAAGRKALRRAEYYVTLSRADPAVSEAEYERWAGPRKIEDRDGLRYDGSRGGQYLLEGAPGETVEARCFGSLTPVLFCDYRARIGPGVVALVTFLDFRNLGGPEPAMARLRGIVAVVCRQPGLACSPTWSPPP